MQPLLGQIAEVQKCVTNWGGRALQRLVLSCSSGKTHLCVLCDVPSAMGFEQNIALRAWGASVPEELGGFCLCSAFSKLWATDRVRAAVWYGWKDQTFLGQPKLWVGIPTAPFLHSVWLRARMQNRSWNFGDWGMVKWKSQEMLGKIFSHVSLGLNSRCM